jgi:integrase
MVAMSDQPTSHDQVPLSPIRQILRDYLDDLKYRVTAAHYTNVQRRLDLVLTSLRIFDVAQVKPVEVVRFRNQRREEGAANRTANLLVDNLSSMLAWAHGSGLIESNPLRNIRRLPDGSGHQRYRRRAMTDAEIEQFLAAAREDDSLMAVIWKDQKGLRGGRKLNAARVPQYSLWRAFLDTGARWSELTRVRWADVDFDQKTLVLRAENTKSKRRRVLPIHQALVDTLKESRATHEQILGRAVTQSDPVFRTPEAAGWCRPTNNAMRTFDRLLVRAGIARVDVEGRKLDIHSLRHTFGSRLARNGVGLVQVQRLMGHSDPKLTAQVYTHLDVDDLRAAVDRVMTQ